MLWNCLGNIFRQLVQALQPNIPFLKQFISFEGTEIYIATRLYCLISSVHSQKTSAAFGGLHRQMSLSFALQLDINLHITILNCL